MRLLIIIMTCLASALWASGFVTEYGAKPKVDTNGSNDLVLKYLRGVANDPNHIKVKCDKDVLELAELGYGINCDFYGRNSFNATVKQNETFLIKKGKVIGQTTSDGGEDSNAISTAWDRATTIKKFHVSKEFIENHGQPPSIFHSDYTPVEQYMNQHYPKITFYQGMCGFYGVTMIHPDYGYISVCTYNSSEISGEVEHKAVFVLSKGTADEITENDTDPTKIKRFKDIQSATAKKLASTHKH